MPRIFISHASEDLWQAAVLHRYLEDKGWGPVFLDAHPERGLKPGQEWEAALKNSLNACLAVICLVSKNWLDSGECRGEYTFARYIARRIIIPIRLGNVNFQDFPAGLADWQATRPLEEFNIFSGALDTWLRDCGLSADSFPYNPKGRSDYTPFRGLAALEEEDAAIFFGRDAEIGRGLRAIRRAAASNGECQVITFKGASGSGKSSLLKAGVLPRIASDISRFIVVPPISLSAISMSRQPSGRIGLAAALGEAFLNRSGAQPSLQSLLEGIATKEAFLQLLTALRAEGAQPSEGPITIVVSIDQFEEALQAESGEAARVLALLDDALRHDPHLLLIVSVRSDAAAELQDRPPLKGRKEDELKVPRLSIGSLSEVVNGPAAAAIPPIKLDPELLPAIATDLSASGSAIGGDALPLLALTLNRLHHSVGHGESLTIDAYHTIGGIEGSINQIVSELTLKGPKQERLVNAIVPALVHIRRDGTELRRVAPADRLDQSDSDALDRLVDARFVVRDVTHNIDGQQSATYAIAHEALFRLWPALKQAITRERPRLQLLERLEHHAEVWAGRHDARMKRMALAHDLRALREVEPLKRSFAYEDRFTSTVNSYISACRAKQWSQIRRYAGAFAAIVVLIAGLAAIQATYAGRSWAQARATASKNPALAVAGAAPPSSILFDFSARKPCEIGAPARPADCILRQTGLAETVLALRRHGQPLNGASVATRFDEVLTFGRDNRGVIWRFRQTDEPVSLPNRDDVTAGALLAPGLAVTGDRAGRISLWRHRTLVAERQAHKSRVAEVAHWPKRWIATGSADGDVAFFSAETLEPLTYKERAHVALVTALHIDETMGLIVSAGRDGRLLFWDPHALSVMRTISTPGNKGVLAMTTSGTKAIVAVESNGLMVWDVVTGRQTVRFKRHLREPTALAVVGSVVASGDFNGDVWIWSADTGEAISGPLRHPGVVRSLALSKDGRLLLVGEAAGAAHLWKVQEGVEVSRYSGEGPVKLVAFASAEDAVIVVDTRGAVQVRGLDDQGRAEGSELRRRVCARPRNQFYVQPLSEEDLREAHPIPFGRSVHPCDWKGLGTF